MRSETETMTALIEGLLTAGVPLRAMTVNDRARELHNVAAAWLDPAYEPRRNAEKMVPRLFGHSAHVVREGLNRLFGVITSESLLEWWTREAPRGLTPPRLAAVLPAGNIPGVAVQPVVACLLAGIPVLVRLPLDPLFLGFLESIQDLSPVLADAFRAARWDYADRIKEEEALGRAERILVFGSDETIDRLEARHPGRVRGYGTSVSLAFVGRDRILDPDAARALALDVAIWDQQGCLSPQAVYIEGGFAEARAFGERLARAMERMQAEFPARTPTVAEAARQRTRRAEIEAAIVAGEELRLWSPGPSLDWSVLACPDSTFRAGTDRSVPVLPIPGFEDLPGRLAPMKSLLQAAGIAVTDAARPGVTRILRAAGFGHVVELGTMQNPPPGWRNKGRDLLRDLLEPTVSAGKDDAHD